MEKTLNEKILAILNKDFTLNDAGEKAANEIELLVSKEHVTNLERLYDELLAQSSAPDFVLTAINNYQDELTARINELNS